MIIIHCPMIDKTSAKVFKESFKNIKGFAVLTAKDPDLDFFVKLYEQPLKSWKEPILQKIKDGVIVSGVSTQVSNEDIASQKKAAEEAKTAAEKSQSAKLASATFSAATMKRQLLINRSPKDKVQAYFSWKETAESFHKSRATALLKRFDQESKNLNWEALKNFGHPRSQELNTLLEESKELLKSQNFALSGDKAGNANTILQEIFKDVTANLLDLIKQSQKEKKDENTYGLIKSLNTLKPEFKLQFAYPGQTYTNEAGIKFVFIPPGEFTMGSPKSEIGHEGDETQHKVYYF